MVATLVKLKWRLTLNALTKNVWAIIGTVFGALYGLGALGLMLAGAVGLGLKADPDVIMLVLGSLGALLVVGWAMVPLLVTGVDSTLDPRAMAAWAAPSRRLALGLLAAGALGIPGCITAAVCLIPVLTWLLAGQLPAALLALLCAPAALATCVLLSRIIVTAAGISSSRRGRETTAIIAFVFFLVVTQAPNLIPRILGDDPTGFLQQLRTLAKVMGLKDGTTSHAEFPTIIPSIGTKFDVGISSFTINSEREQQTNMIAYVQVGSAYGVAQGNPKGFDPAQPCGKTIGVQTGTAQEEYVNKLSEECVSAGNEAITVMPHDVQTSVATKVVGGQYDATLADSTVIGYTAALSQGKIEQIGDVIESAPQGIAVNKQDAALTEAVQKAAQYLMDHGYLQQILAPYGAEGAALTTAELNPQVND